MNPWLIEGVITDAKELAARNGFRLEPAEYSAIKIVAQKQPYGKDVVVARYPDWQSVQIYFAGYEQAKMETRALAGFGMHD